MPQKAGRESRKRRKGREGLYMYWALKPQLPDPLAVGQGWVLA